MVEFYSEIDPFNQVFPNMAAPGYHNGFIRELYCMFHRYIMNRKKAEKWGFPFLDENGKVRYLSNQFSKLQASSIEKCRCGKEINLKEPNWHLDEKGCEFHPGKLFYFEEYSAELYSCCKKSCLSQGCVWRPHHVSSMKVRFEDEFVKTQKKSIRFPNIFALDCEMVYTTKGIEVVKVTVMSVFCVVVYDTFVKPSHPVIDYNTEFSGIDESHLSNVTTTLKDVQTVLLDLFDAHTILVGHGLENDLLCLNLCHNKIIDTSILYPHSKGFPYRHSLKYLAKIHLSKQIHCDSKGHDSQEDAITCIELVARKIYTSQTGRFFSINPHLTSVFPGISPQSNIPGNIPNPGGLYQYDYPMVYMNLKWTTAYPGFCVTNSVVYPVGFL